jgi:hypothetical protein
MTRTRQTLATSQARPWLRPRHAALLRRHGGGLPRYIERELAAYLKCGILAHGFVAPGARRVATRSSSRFPVDRAASAQAGFARTAHGSQLGAAHLVTGVLPRAPFRQWVFSVPKPLRLRLARDPAWARWAGQLVVRAIGVWQRRVARARGLAAPRTGAVVFRQRFPAGRAHPPRRARPYAVIEDFKIALSKTPVHNVEKTYGIKKARARGKPIEPKPSRLLSPKTINKLLTVLRRMLVVARKRGLIENVPEVSWLKSEKPEFDFLDFEEAKRLRFCGKVSGAR